MNDETDMSISEREAEQQYPTRYWDGHPGVKEFFNCTTDDLQDAYMRGREAEPCKEQIESVAKTLAVVSAYTTEDGYCYLSRIDKAVEEDEDHWSYISGNRRDDLMAIAKRLLDAARKAVM